MTNTASISQINLRLETELKDKIYATLKALGTTPSEAIRDYFEHIVKVQKVPFKRHVVSDEDMELLAIAKERLETMTESDIIKDVNLDDLLARHPQASRKRVA
ncbi:type II toxin-antitoxin system RelB/DinJ family antitoxin [Gluconobacter frateurii]|uniref:Translation repressor RelE/RelB/StbE n=1 Tax=Gluconobacter frateurii NRIC 0228 TaxID=1307946 RepID=A0ABQ0QD99_9PROT|nr:type II toxin-antitoxin system RelB/DinJ family antitoxin [Gluconobacter frateurii]GBR14129.1 translation repressor RelE/RelB/StbE [Gluconobacter frateurii NRIC 0228]GLP92012.1 hypothetical protein GCM10007868_30870 [Gluconobacter frateurii]